MAFSAQNSVNVSIKNQNLSEKSTYQFSMIRFGSIILRPCIFRLHKTMALLNEVINESQN